MIFQDGVVMMCRLVLMPAKLLGVDQVFYRFCLEYLGKIKNKKVAYKNFIFFE